MTPAITDNEAAARFELTENGHTAFANYRKEGNQLFILHVEAPQALRGTGAAGRLMEGIVAHASAHSLAIIPICGYAAAWLTRHKQ